MKTVLTGAVVITCDDRHTIHTPGDVMIDGGRIGYVGPRYDGTYDARVSLGGRLLMPGLINAHTHSPMSLFRGLSDDVDLQVFLFERIWPRELKLTSDDVYAGSLVSAIEMLKCGVTTYVDMYFWEDALVRAALDVGGRVLITPGILDVPAWEPILGKWDRRLADVVAFCSQWQDRDGRIHTGFGPHAPYTLSLESLREVAQTARASILPVNIHLVETRLERDNFNARGTGSTAAALADLGFFDGDVIAAHSVWIDEGDADIYRRHGVGVAHCPQSNAKLGAGVAPLAALLAAGVDVGLGTDGAATNNNHDLWEEIRLAPLLAKALSLDPKVLTAGEALWMATRNGARAIHRPDLGSLETGKRADLISLRLEDTTAVPIFAPETYIAHLVYSMGSQLVDSVWVEGRQVVRDGAVLTIDEASARREFQRVALSLADRVRA